MINQEVLIKYACIYIKRSGSGNVREFVEYARNRQGTMGDFDRIYRGFLLDHPLQNARNQRNTTNGNQRSSHSGGDIKITIVNQPPRWDFWDYLLLQFCINSLFNSRPVAANNITHNYSGGSNNKDSEDSRKLLAAGLAILALSVGFHVGMCYWYSRSKNNAKESYEVDYLSNQLWWMRLVEFSVSAVCIAALIACAVLPGVPAWGLALLAANAVMCFFGVLALNSKLHSQYEQERKDIKLAENIVDEIMKNSCSPPQDPQSDVPSGYPQSEYGHQPMPTAPPSYNESQLLHGQQPIPNAPPGYMSDSRANNSESGFVR